MLLPLLLLPMQDSVQDLFYNRSREIAALRDIFDDDKPSGILVVTGPSNTGTTVRSHHQQHEPLQRASFSMACSNHLST